jgi:Putative prokaryotic signal transducing protein
MPPRSLVPLKSFASRSAAELARAILEANGIEAVISSDDAGGMQPWFQQLHGVRLLVPHEHAIRAAWLLEQEVSGE